MSLKHDPCHSWDKLGLFVLAALVVCVLGIMVAGPFIVSAMPDKADVLLGGIATGLILFLRDLVAAVRTSWEEVTRAETNKQLAQGGPTPAPQNAKDAAEQTANAAVDEAAAIGAKP